MPLRRRAWRIRWGRRPALRARTEGRRSFRGNVDSAFARLDVRARRQRAIEGASKESTRDPDGDQNALEATAAASGAPRTLEVRCASRLTVLGCRARSPGRVMDGCGRGSKSERGWGGLCARETRP